MQVQYLAIENKLYHMLAQLVDNQEIHTIYGTYFVKNHS